MLAVILDVAVVVVAIQFSGGPFVERMSGRLLCYVAPNNGSDLAVAALAAGLTGRHTAT